MAPLKEGRLGMGVGDEDIHKNILIPTDIDPAIYRVHSVEGLEPTTASGRM